MDGQRTSTNRTYANETGRSRNNRNSSGTRRGGGNRQRRGGVAQTANRSTRFRTESWPAVRTDGSSSVPFSNRREHPNDRMAGRNLADGMVCGSLGRETTIGVVTTADAGGFARDFGRMAVGRPTIVRPALHYDQNWYFDPNNLRGGFCAMNSPIPSYGLNMPMHPPPMGRIHWTRRQHRPPAFPSSGDVARQIGKRFENLQLNGTRPAAARRKGALPNSGDATNEPLTLVPALLAKRELGIVNRDKTRREIAHVRVRDGGKKPDGTATTVKNVLADCPGETLRWCQFMEATPDGKNIFGSWALRDRDWSRIMCAAVSTGRGAVEEGQYGVELQPSDNYIYVMDNNVVDLCRARIDTSVTCVLYLTVPSQDSPGSRIFLQPVPELSNTNDQSVFTTPIYNAHWALSESALSCAWDFTKMRLSVGLARYGMIFDVVSETDFKLFSCHKNVLAQKFNKDGSLLFMGIRDSSIFCCDLRRQFHHAVYALPQSSACWLHLMSDSNYLVAADLSGQIKLWDLRKQGMLLSFDAGISSRTKLPVAVDEQDSLIFAVSDNGTTSGWSLKTGQLLRQISCPSAISDRRNLPRVCYSGCWGGVAGNSAVVLGVGDEAHFYEFQL